MVDSPEPMILWSNSSKSPGRWQQTVEDYVIAVFPQDPANKMSKSVEVKGGNVVRFGYRPDSSCMQ